MNERNAGGDFDDFLREKGLIEEVEAVASKRVLAFQIVEAMKELELSKADMAHARPGDPRQPLRAARGLRRRDA
jgi:hypothetical protein